ncbi:hypothetical protein SLA2020_368340 [Shorea laevis]
MTSEGLWKSRVRRWEAAQLCYHSEGPRWQWMAPQLRKLVKHVEQKGFAGKNVIPLRFSHRWWRRGDGRFAEVVVGEGQTKELEKRSEGGLGKADQNLGKIVVKPGNMAPVISAPVISATADIVGQAGMLMVKTVMEGNVKALKEILISFKIDIDRCLKQLELGQPFSGVVVR